METLPYPNMHLQSNTTMQYLPPKEHNSILQHTQSPNFLPHNPIYSETPFHSVLGEYQSPNGHRVVHPTLMNSTVSPNDLKNPIMNPGTHHQHQIQRYIPYPQQIQHPDQHQFRNLIKPSVPFSQNPDPDPHQKQIVAPSESKYLENNDEDVLILYPQELYEMSTQLEINDMMIDAKHQQVTQDRLKMEEIRFLTLRFHHFMNGNNGFTDVTGSSSFLESWFPQHTCKLNPVGILCDPTFRLKGKNHVMIEIPNNIITSQLAMDVIKDFLSQSVYIGPVNKDAFSPLSRLRETDITDNILSFGSYIGTKLFHTMLSNDRLNWLNCKSTKEKHNFIQSFDEQTRLLQTKFPIPLVLEIFKDDSFPISDRRAFIMNGLSQNKIVDDQESCPLLTKLLELNEIELVYEWSLTQTVSIPDVVFDYIILNSRLSYLPLLVQYEIFDDRIKAPNLSNILFYPMRKYMFRQPHSLHTLDPSYTLALFIHSRNVNPVYSLYSSSEKGESSSPFNTPYWKSRLPDHMYRSKGLMHDASLYGQLMYNESLSNKTTLYKEKYEMYAHILRVCTDPNLLQYIYKNIGTFPTRFLSDLLIMIGIEYASKEPHLNVDDLSFPTANELSASGLKLKHVLVRIIKMFPSVLNENAWEMFRYWCLFGRKDLVSLFYSTKLLESPKFRRHRDYEGYRLACYGRHFHLTEYLRCWEIIRKPKYDTTKPLEQTGFGYNVKGRTRYKNGKTKDQKSKFKMNYAFVYVYLSDPTYIPLLLQMENDLRNPDMYPYYRPSEFDTNTKVHILDPTIPNLKEKILSVQKQTYLKAQLSKMRATESTSVRFGIKKIHGTTGHQPTARNL